jgi:dCMP deaminase
MSERAEIKRLVFMQIARELSHLGTCDRAQVGAVIVKQGRCISWGYNGAAPGMPHCDENKHGWYGQWPPGMPDPRPGRSLRKDELWTINEWQNEAVKTNGCRNATHAEANALAYAARQGISTDGATLYVTLSPCDTCARLLIAAGIRAVDYDEEYRDRTGIDLFVQLGGQVSG